MSILHPSFRYTPSYETNLRKTFAQFHSNERVAAEIAAQAAADDHAAGGSSSVLIESAGAPTENRRKENA